MTMTTKIRIKLRAFLKFTLRDIPKDNTKLWEQKEEALNALRVLWQWKDVFGV